MEKWAGKIAVVTGASAGIGAAIVEALAREGVNVVGLARRRDRVEALAETLKAARGKVYAVECDVTSPESIRKAFDYIEKVFGGVDILVNNAGLLKKAFVFDMDAREEDYLVTINTNLAGLLLVSRRAYKTMQDKEFGYIVNINSNVGQMTASMDFTKCGFNVYQPTKHAVTQLTAIMKFEIANTGKNIRITSISPGPTETDIDLVGNITPEGGRFWDLTAHLQASDIADQVIHCLSSKNSVNISELTVEPLGLTADISSQ